MATSQDHAWGLVKESVYGTALTPSRFYPWIDGNNFDWEPRPRQSAGIPGGSGRRALLGSRRFLPNGIGTATTKVELESKGAGVLLDIALGLSGVTSITGGSQQIYHTQITGMVLPSATLQSQEVRNDGTTLVKTLRGCTPNKITFEQPADGIPTVSVDWDVLGFTTATAAASITYPSTPTIFDASQAQASYGGTLTAPTTTTLGTGLTSVGYFRSWKLEIDQNINTDGWVLNAGVRSQPKAGQPGIKFTADVEHNDSVLTAAYVAGTKNPLYVTYTTTESLSAGYTQLQVVVPQLALTKGLPQAAMATTPTVFGIEGDVLNDGTNRDFYVVVRTTDTVL